MVEGLTVEELARLKALAEAAIRSAEDPSVGYPEYERLAEPFRRAVRSPTDILALITQVERQATEIRCLQAHRDGLEKAKASAVSEWNASIARLEAEVERLTEEREALSVAILGGRSGFALVEAGTLRARADTLAAENETLRLLLRESQDGIGGDWRARRDAAIARRIK